MISAETMPRGLAAYVGASAHPRSASAVFDRISGHFRAPREQGALPETERVYEFNSLGFRGSEYNSSALLRVFVCGCSYTFGMGVDADRTWPIVFTRLASAALGLPIDQSHVQNFSQIGASNNYVARTIIKQCHLASPTLAVAAFTHNNRIEYLDGQEIRNLGYWNIRADKNVHEPHDSPGRRFFQQYSDYAGLQNLLLNMVFFQSAMVRRGVPYIIVWIDIEGLHTAQTRSSSLLSHYYTVLDQSRISSVSIKQPGIRVDAADGHPGPLSHELFAAALAKEFSGRLLSVRSSDRHHGAETLNLGLGRLTRASADRVARTVISVAVRERPRATRLAFGDNLAVEHFVAERPVELNLERHAWTIAAMRLRTAYAAYITADLLRFNFWQNLLMAREFILASGGQFEVWAPECWFVEPGSGSPVIYELLELLDRDSVSPLPSRTQSRAGELETRVAEAKRRLRDRRIDNLLRCVFGPQVEPRREDPNIYPLW